MDLSVPILKDSFDPATMVSDMLRNVMKKSPKTDKKKNIKSDNFSTITPHLDNAQHLNLIEELLRPISLDSVRLFDIKEEKVGKSSVGLYDCIQQFMAVEVLEGENPFACDFCFKLKYGITPEEDEEEEKALKKALKIVEEPKIEEKKLDKDSESETSSAHDASLSDPQIVIEADLAASATSDESTSNQTEENNNSGTEGKSESVISNENSEVKISANVINEIKPVENINLDTVKENEIVKPITPAESITKTENSLNPLLNVRKRLGFSSKSRANLNSPSTTVSTPTPVIPSPVSTPQKVNRPLVRGKAYKRYLMHSLPEILVVNLKRFTQIGLSGRTKKVEDFVSFNDVIDMQDYLAPPDVIAESTRRQTVQILKSLDQLAGKIKSENQPDMPDRLSEIDKMRDIVKKQMNDAIENCQIPILDTQYKLYGVVVHSGSLLSGHYTSYVRLRKRKTEISDIPAKITSENVETTPAESISEKFETKSAEKYFETALDFSEESLDQLVPDEQSDYVVVSEGSVEKLGNSVITVVSDSEALESWEDVEMLANESKEMESESPEETQTISTDVTLKAESLPENGKAKIKTIKSKSRLKNFVVSKQMEKEENESEDNWIYCSDTTVRTATHAEVMSCQAFILFYEKF
ncbi:hypothetical protein HK096_005559 [Nowakowskiella sp. JEL0078]|nr:hypothetical protein HK096_005559 [Nowakowskiella sp. JEL0078]